MNFLNISKLFYYVTHRCDRSCVYCDVIRFREFLNAGDEVSLFKVKDAIKYLKKIGLKEVSLTGGEPFLKKGIFDFIKFCVDIGLEISVVTKYIFSDVEIEKLKKTGLKKITVSLDTIDKKTLTETIGSKYFADNVLNNISKLVKEGFIVNVNSVMHKKTFNDLKKTVEELYKLKINHIRPQLMSFDYSVISNNSSKLDLSKKQELVLSNEDIEEFKKIMRELNKEKKYKGLINYSAILNLFPKFKQTDEEIKCPLQEGILTIDPYGRVPYCAAVADFFIGDLRKNSLKEILESKMVQDFVLPKRENYKGTKCFDCKDFKYCKYLYRCYPALKKEYGSFFVPIEEYCEKMPELREKIKEKYGLD